MNPQNRIVCLTLGSILSALPLWSQESDDPAAELASFQIADGFQASLFASEKDGVIKPIQIRFDPKGRLWVIGSSVYPQIEPGQTPNDKVLILEDTDGDGRCDRTTVFADGLMIPTGIELGNGGAYVGHGPELLFLKDTDGDGRADERRILLRGFGTGDNHQNINSFLWGPGGELWMSQGLHIHSRVETPWGAERLDRAGIWRLRPQRLRLEGFYGTEHEPQNPWGFVFTDWGELIVLAGNNSSPIYGVPGLVPNRRDEAPPLIWPTGQGRKCSGGDIVGTAHFPDEWQGRLITGGYINNAVWTIKLVNDGSGFRFEDAPPLIRSTSRKFRPVDVKFGPDGALYICDWYNPIIGHYQASFRHPDRDKTHGRIWRVTAKGRPLTPRPTLAGVSIVQLLEHLTSTDRWTRQFAKRALAERTPDDVKAALDRWVDRPGLSELALKEALGVCQSHEIVVPNLLSRLCRARDAGARAYAAGVVGLWADRLENPLTLLTPLARDENSRVRVQAVVACAYVRKPQAIETALAGSDFATDKFLDYALRQTVFSLKPEWLQPFQAGRLTFQGNLSRLGLLVRADGTPDTVAAVRSLARASKLDRRERENYWRLLAEVGDGNDYSALLRSNDPELQARVLPAFVSAARSRRIPPPEDVSLHPLIDSADDSIRGEAVKLAGQWKLTALESPIASLALGHNTKPVLRHAAIEALGKFGDDASRSNLLHLAQENSPDVQSAAVIALTEIDLGLAAQLAPNALASEGKRAQEIFTAFLSREGGAAALEKAFVASRPSKTAAEVGLRVMNTGGKRHETLARSLAQAAGTDRDSAPVTSEDMPRFLAEIRAAGNPNRGAQIFRRAELGCLACHSVNGEGGNIGPDLSALGTAQPLDFIVGAILEPQKEIKEGYTSLSVTTRDGNELQGYIARETREEIVLRDVLQNKEIHLPRNSIKEKHANGSVMPEGLVNTLTRDEFRDLVRYLGELGGKSRN
jgi:putative heme-binding domain-containing protein